MTSKYFVTPEEMRTRMLVNCGIRLSDPPTKEELLACKRRLMEQIVSMKDKSDRIFEHIERIRIELLEVGRLQGEL